MEKKDRSAAATAGDKKVEFIPPVNSVGEVHESILSVYGALRGIRDDFKGVVGQFRAIEELDKHFMCVIKFSLPVEWNTVGGKCGVNCYEATDEGFAEQIHAYTQGKNNVARLTVLVKLAKVLDRAVADAERKHRKLDERVKLQERNSSEWHTAVELRIKASEAVTVLKNRLMMVAKLFLDTRKRIALDILDASNAVANIFLTNDDKYDERFSNELVKSNAESAFDCIVRLGDVVREKSENKSYKGKGWKV